ncbi:MAG: SurA N-terminal domain-containing protein [Chromatiaceae bacterium]|nr:SurA N-terminal domain-containing protein [Chromatiaceae bacterium]
MLQEIRERAQGWIAWGAVILISIPFAFWGIQSYIGGGTEPVVATVNGAEITARSFDRQVEETRMRLRERLGAAYRPELFEEQALRAQVLEGMIQEQLLLQVSHDMGLRASNRELQAAILSNPAFQRDGRFDKATYDRMLELQGTSGPQYEESLRQRIVGTQIQRAVTASELATEVEMAEAIRLDRQQRRLAYIRLAKTGFLDTAPVPEEEVQAWYQAHADRYLTPERVKLSYLVLDAATLDAGQPVDEEALRRLYEDERERFREPEQRRARHILVTLAAGADATAEAEAKARIEAIQVRLAAGEDFATLARELSQDPGSAPQGGDLGLFGQGVMDPAFEQAAFSLETGATSEPVRSQFGYHLIQVTEIQPETLKAFEEVREQLRAEATRGGAEAAFYDMAERLANLVYENPDSLEPAAEALGLQLQSSDWIGREGGADLLANPKLIAAAFSPEVLHEGVNSDLIEPEAEALQALVLRVTEHEEAAPKPLDAVREEIIAAIREQKASAAAQAEAKAMTDRLLAGEALTSVAGKHPITETGLVQRDAESVPGEIIDLAFTLPRPAPGAASYSHSPAADGDALVVAVTEVVDGNLAALDQAALTQASRELIQVVGRGYYDSLIKDMENRSKIERKPTQEASVQ